MLKMLENGTCHIFDLKKHEKHNIISSESSFSSSEEILF